MKQLKLKFYADPGHGWLAVKRKILEEFNLLRDISRFSYQKGKTVYLEEDSDAVKFIKMAAEKSIKVIIETKIQNRYSPIRSYERFSNT